MAHHPATIDHPNSQPPAESFWERYSPHHEFSLSSVGSLTLHALLLGLLVLASILGFFTLVGLEPTAPPQLDALTVHGGGGGGGDPLGVGRGIGGKGDPLVEDVRNDPEPAPYVGTPLAEIPRAKVDPLQFPVVASDPDGKRFIEKSNLAVVALSKLQQEARDQLLRGLAGKGEGGPGKEGGRDTGSDKGTTPSPAPAKPLTKREKRVLRWVMVFNVRDGFEYLRQLDGLGAILGIPEARGQYRILRNLKQRPARGEIEDLKSIERIFWVDDTADSVRSLGRALQLEPLPNHIVAFFPREVEEDLLRKELNFRGLQEEDIQETRFRLIRHGNKYVPQVIDQIPIRR